MSEPLPRRALIEAQPEAQPIRPQLRVVKTAPQPQADRALPLRAEIRRQLRRRRTQGIFAVLLLLPLILLAAFALGSDDSDTGQRGFVDLAQESGANLVVFAMFASTSFLLIVIVALFAGDTIPSEASWSSLRYLLAAPVRRERLIRQKLIVAALSSIVALFFLPAWTLVVGGIAYGWGPYVGPTGDQIGWPAFAGRLVIIVCYLLIELSVVAAFAFTLGVLTDAPLAAVGGAVLLMIVCAILDSITALGDIRQGLPGHYAYAWADALAPTVDFSDMITGALWSIGYAIVLISFAVWHFLRKDITS
jgi:ABC-2 type transport system permease protein